MPTVLQGCVECCLSKMKVEIVCIKLVLYHFFFFLFEKVDNCFIESKKRRYQPEQNVKVMMEHPLH